ncbi:hypothetical protein [Streptomyces sp. NPDC058664]|uniref:hypothetical protein n=1 Tax=unclassified Streptomyces TaxID=2593676 RepID=UPI003649A6EC
MPVRAARPTALTAAERQRSKKAAYGHKTPYQARARSQTVLLATGGGPNARIAVEAGARVDTARTWRGRFAGGGLDDLPVRLDRHATTGRRRESAIGPAA